MVADKKELRLAFLNPVDALVLFVVVEMVCLNFSLCWGFSLFWEAIPLMLLLVWMGAFLWRHESAYLSIPCWLSLIAIVAVNAPTIPKLYPLWHTVQPASFQDATVAEVLLHVAKSHDEEPRWRFFVSSEELALTRVTMTIPAGASLGEALDSLMAESGASYSWRWYKFCGNAPVPMRASFHVRYDDSRDPSGHPLNSEVFIDARDETVDVTPMRTTQGDLSDQRERQFKNGAAAPIGWRPCRPTSSFGTRRRCR